MNDKSVFARTRYVILYHQFCPDGWCALAVADMWLSKKYSRDLLQYIPVMAGKTDAVVDQLVRDYGKLSEDDQPLILSFDLNFTYWGAKKLLRHFPYAHILDHHLTTELCFVKPDDETDEEFAKYMSIVNSGAITYDKSISGAMLAWKYFYGVAPAPALVLYIQDKDLWEWKLPNSREVNAGLSETLTTAPAEGPMTRTQTTMWAVQEWGKYLLNDDWVETARSNGAMIMNIQNRTIKRLVRDGALRNIPVDNVVHRAFVINTSMYISELGEYVYMLEGDTPGTYKYDFVVIWRYDQVRDVVCVSLRARGDYPIDLAALSQTFEWTKDGKRTTGGGHKSAAGFECDLRTFFLWIGGTL